MSRGGEEELPPCTKSNLVYENLCIRCNPGATGKMEPEDIRIDIPTVYIGETSRSIFERSKEHWEGANKGSEKNHMVKHQRLEHEGEPEPKFQMKVRGFFKTALSRQVAEAVYIRRRGGEGAILNSKGEFSRSYIPRLQVVPEEQGAENNMREITARTLKEQDVNWEQARTRELGNKAILGPKSSPIKRHMEQGGEGETPIKKSKRRRKLKHEVLENWGELPTDNGAPLLAPLNMEPEPDNGGGVLPTNNQFLGADHVRSNLSLEQQLITEFYNPAPSTNDRPTQHNQVASTKDVLDSHSFPTEGGSPRSVHSTPISQNIQVNRFEEISQDTGQEDISCIGRGNGY